MKLTISLLLATISISSNAQQRFAQMEQAIAGGLYPKVHSVLVFQNGKTVYERYFNGYRRDSLHDTRSSFKSITSLLVGIAIDKGLIKNVDQKVCTFFPQDTAFNSDPLKRQMTIRNVLEMRTGLDCEEWNDTHDCESEMENASDWVKFSLALPMKNAPGTVWAYTSCASMMLSGIIEKASGMSVMRFAKEYLFSQLGITNYKWTIDPSGHGMTAGSFYIRPEDMLKVGEMVLNRGEFRGKQIVSREWIRESTRAEILIPEGSFVKSSRSTAATPQPAYYGYQWYNEVIKTPTGSYTMVFASGNGGQYIIIIQQLQLVVVFTQGNFGSRVAKQAFDILAKFILPSK
jgi:CubicO group peptidase (beta-lactamase class C family)